MKIVVNDGGYGFGLSPLAFKKLAELQGREIYFYVYKYNLDNYFKVNNVEDIENDMFFYPVTKDLGDIASEDDIFNYMFKEPERNDPLLVKVVEILGEKANGEYAELKIVEIPDDVDWIIEEYDGAEWVSEKHRIWR